MNYQEHIEINSEVRFGKPCIKHTRITVYDILGMLANDMSIEEIVKDFPKLSKASIMACLSYSADRERRVKVLR